MRYKLKKELEKLFERELSESVATDFRKLIAFVDAALYQSFKLSGDDRAEFLVKNMLNMRDYMSSEILIETTKVNIKGDILEIFDSFMSSHDLSMSSLEEIKRKKKESASEEEQGLQENLSETDQSTSLKEEES